MISIYTENDGLTVTIKFSGSTNLPCIEVFKQKCGNKNEAFLLSEYLRKKLVDIVSDIRVSSYMRGWHDAKAKSSINIYNNGNLYLYPDEIKAKDRYIPRG